jgi:hypothetical protein
MLSSQYVPICVWADTGYILDALNASAASDDGRRVGPT